MCEIIPSDAKTICHRDMIVYYLGNITTTSDVWTKGNVPTYPDRVYAYDSVAKAKETIDVLKGYGYIHNQCTSEPLSEGELADGTIVCLHGDIIAKTGGYNGVDHLIIDRSDNGPDIWSSSFTVGTCTDGQYDEIPDGDEPDPGEPNDEPNDDIPPGDEYPPKSTPWLYIGAAIILFYLLTRG